MIRANFLPSCAAKFKMFGSKFTAWHLILSEYCCRKDCQKNCYMHSFIVQKFGLPIRFLRYRYYLLTGLLIVSVSLSAKEPTADGRNHPRPNIILILADDLGFSDIGSYGGEIETPQLDELAKHGLQYKQFYNAARCCPSRAALMTGLYPHQAGMGWMAAADLGTPAYEGNLNNNSVTIAEVLKSAGYSTYMTGKWHLTNERKMRGSVKDNWPKQRGFDRYFGIIQGGDNYFTPKLYSNNTSYPAPKGFYLTNAISDTSVAYIKDHFKAKKEDPFFMYVAYTAPHWPLHALKPEIDKYIERYKKGWDVLRKERFLRQYSGGLVSHAEALSDRDKAVDAWEKLSPSEQEDMAMRMAIYAAQVDLMDQGIKQIIDALRDQKALDNTLIFFLSDNGACAEFISRDNKLLDGTNPMSFESYRINWANLSSTPFREYKHYVHEGGIASPLIVHWPAGIDKGMNGFFVKGYGHITDIMATCIQVAEASYPSTYNAHTIQKMEGKSLVPHFSGKDNNRGDIFWEHEGNIAMRDGKWKLVAQTKERTRFNKERLELYDMEADPSELNNLAEKYPDRINTMYQKWDQWAKRIGAYPLDTRTYGEREQAFRRKINGSFDDNLGDWNIYVARPNLATVGIDTTNKISGANSAIIKVEQNAARPGEIAMHWPFQAKKGEKFSVKIASKANRYTDIIVSLEATQGGNVLFKEKIPVAKKVKVNSFDVVEVPKDGRYRVSLLFGSASAGSQIWIDDIDLTAM